MMNKVIALIALAIAGWMLITQAIVVIAPYIAGGLVIALVIKVVLKQLDLENSEDEE